MGLDTGEYEAILAETVPIAGHDGDRILAYFARPLGRGPYPGIVLFHHLPGWDDWYREVTRRFAAAGYLAICPDLYARAGTGSPIEVAERVRADGGVSDDQVVGDGNSCVAYLRALPYCGGRIGLFGTCSGGRHAYLAGCRGDAVEAVVNCWGGRVVAGPDELTDKHPVAPIDYTSALPCPVLGLFGNDDTHPSPEQVDILEEALRAHHKEYEFHRYDGAGHGFMYADRPSAYRADAAVDAWSRIWAFLSRTLY